MDLKSFEFEYKQFCTLFCNFNVGMKDLKEITGKTSVTDILNPYRCKILKSDDLNQLKTLKLNDFNVFKGLNTDLVFISFKTDKNTMNSLIRIFNGSNRAYRKYKHEFTKKERSLLFKLKNTDKYEYNHRDCISESLQIDLNGEYSVLPLENTYKNPIQTFESEYQFKSRKKREKWAEIKRKQQIRSNAIKALRLWKTIKMPRLPRYKKEKKEKFNLETLKKEKGWRTGQKRDLLGLLYIDAYGNLDTDLTVAPIKIPQKIIKRETVFISTEKIEEKEKRTLW